MATTIIKVYNPTYGRWQQNAKVVIGWDGIINLGMSSPVYTKQDGVAIIQYNAIGEATVYVNRRAFQKIYTPGSANVNI